MKMTKIVRGLGDWPRKEKAIEQESHGHSLKTRDGNPWLHITWEETGRTTVERNASRMRKEQARIEAPHCSRGRKLCRLFGLTLSRITRLQLDGAFYLCSNCRMHHA